MKNTIKYIKKYSWCICEALTVLMIGIAITISASLLLVFQACAWPLKYIVTKCIAFDKEHELTEMV